MGFELFLTPCGGFYQGGVWKYSIKSENDFDKS